MMSYTFNVKQTFDHMVRHSNLDQNIGLTETFLSSMHKKHI